MPFTPSRRLPRPLQLAIAQAARRRLPTPAVQRDDLLCSICFDMLCFPVTLPCGHNFDRGCILTAWAHAASSRVASLSPSPRETDEDSAEEGLVQGAGVVGPGNQVPEAPPAGSALQRGHLCPLCRQPAAIDKMEELQVNLLLKDLIASLYPAETSGAATPAKRQCPHLTLPASPRSSVGALTTHTAASAFRSRPSLRTFSSFVYVCVASVTDPPGFVLAVLLLLVLLATACSPQPATAPPAASAMVMFDTMDRVCNGLSLLIHRISLQMDQVDQVSPWIRLLSYLI